MSSSTSILPAPAPAPSELPDKGEQPKAFLLPPDDVRYAEVARLLAVGASPIEAVCTLEFDLPSGQKLDKDYKLTQEDHEFAEAVAAFPAVQELFRAIISTTTEKFAITIEEKRAFLRAVIMTPLSAITEDSILCSEFEESETYCKDLGRPIIKRKIKKIDSLRALDMDNKLAGSYSAEKIDVGAEGLIDVVQRIRNSANNN